MRVLLTGHRGYIGSVMTPMLLQAGHQVTGLDSDLYQRCTYAEGGVIADVPTIQKDTRDVELATSRASMRSSILPRSPTIRSAISGPA